MHRPSAIHGIDVSRVIVMFVISVCFESRRHHYFSLSGAHKYIPTSDVIILCTFSWIEKRSSNDI